MRDDVHADPAPPPSGGFIRLQARAADLGSSLGPIWAALAGVLASGAFRGQGEDWLRLALLLLFVDAGWGTLWSAMASTDWSGPLHSWHTWHKNREISTLPYTLPGAPGARVSQWTGRLWAWWREAVWPTCGSGIRAILVALPLTALLGLLLGPELLLLSGAALALMQLGVIWEGGRAAAPPGWDAFIAVTLPWLAGHVAFEAVTFPSAALATLFALAWGNAWNAASRRARTLMVGSQLISAAGLVALNQPLAAGALFLLLIPQTALLPWLQRDLATDRFVRYTRPWLMAAMVVAAVVL